MNIIKSINSIMKENMLPYAYVQWNGAVKYPYIIGEYIESPTNTEDGRWEYDFILTITNKGTWEQVEKLKGKIIDIFPKIYGNRITTDNGVVVIFYSHSLTVPTGTEEYQREEIHLKVKEWRE